MLKIINCGIREFRRQSANKNVYIYGAGKVLENCLNVYFQEKDVRLIIDKNATNWGKTVFHRNQTIEIRGVEQLVKEFSDVSAKEDAIIFVSSPVYAAEIVEELDEMPELDGACSYILPLIRNTYEPIADFEFNKGESIIPKTLHYIWFGKKEMPYEFQKNIETWHRYNPNYEIVRWDENNYNIETNPYVMQAYEMGEYSFASNYARFDIIYNNGGIYLDTDVEIVSSLDALLTDKAFFNMGSVDKVNTGCGFGSVKNGEIVHGILREYERLAAELSGVTRVDKANHLILHKILCEYGFRIDNEYQRVNENVLYPCNVMSPLLMIPGVNYIDEKTVSIHKEAGTWRKGDSNNVQSGVIRLLNRIEHQ